MPIEALSPQQAKIIDDLRVRICLAPCDQEGTDIVFRESELAKQYGMSRTPIRQCLQYLSHCLMVETHTGFGTIPTPLKPENRDSDLRGYRAISLACAEFTAGLEVPANAVVEMVSAQTWLELEADRSEEAFVMANSRVIRGMSSAVPNRFLRHAYVVAHWQTVRWRIRDLRSDNEFHWQKLYDALDFAVRAARGRKASELFEFASKLSLNHMSNNIWRPVTV